MNHYPFKLIPLPYSFSALEPYIDEKTMQIHHDRHLKGYVDKLNAALKDYEDLHEWSLEQLLYYSNTLPPKIQSAVVNNGGGVYNHNFFFANLTPPVDEPPQTADLMYAINQTFGSYEEFKRAFKEEALRVFGSGYTWLVASTHGHLEIVSTKNQDTILTLNAWPIMCIDVWEHAYYLKHYNLRGDYIDDFFNIINLNEAEKNYQNYGIIG